MRWELLFADIEAQLEAADDAARQEEIAERTRAELAHVLLLDRLRACVGVRLTVMLRDGRHHHGTLVESAGQWILLADASRRILVPMAAVAQLVGLERRVAAPAGAVERRLGLGHVLRALARDRAVVRIRTEAGDIVGRLERVGADHVDLTSGAEAMRGRDEPRGTTVPFTAVLSVISG